MTLIPMQINGTDCPDCECEGLSCRLQIGLSGSLTPAPEKAIWGRRNGGSGNLLPFEIDHADSERKAVVLGAVTAGNEYRDDILTGAVAIAGCVDDSLAILAVDCTTKTDGSCTASSYTPDPNFTGYQVVGISFPCFVICPGGNPFNRASLCADGKVKPGANTTSPFGGGTGFLVYYFGGTSSGPDCGIFPAPTNRNIILLELATGEFVYLADRYVGSGAETGGLSGSFTGRFAFGEALADTGNVEAGIITNPCTWYIDSSDYDLDVNVLAGPNTGTTQTWKDGHGQVRAGDIVLGAVYSGGDVLIIQPGCSLPRGS